jgi:hypothetical protein
MLERFLRRSPWALTLIHQAGEGLMTNSDIPAYRVQLLPAPMVIDADGLPVANSHVVEIVFPGDTIVTTLGKVNTIVGAGTAKIIVDDATYRGISLC